MTDDALKEAAPLGGFALKAPGASLNEEAGMAMAAVTVARNRHRAFGTAFKKAFGRPPPGPTGAISSKGRSVVASARDQFLVAMEMPPAELAAFLEDAFAGTATVTDQSDGWARLGLSGPRARETLERLAMLDLADAAFGIGRAARTVFERCPVILVRERPGAEEALRFTILTPRSSAASLLHALTASPPFK